MFKSEKKQQQQKEDFDIKKRREKRAYKCTENTQKQRESVYQFKKKLIFCCYATRCDWFCLDSTAKPFISIPQCYEYTHVDRQAGRYIVNQSCHCSWSCYHSNLQSAHLSIHRRRNRHSPLYLRISQAEGDNE